MKDYKVKVLITMDVSAVDSNLAKRAAQEVKNNVQGAGVYSLKGNAEIISGKVVSCKRSNK